MKKKRSILEELIGIVYLHPGLTARDYVYYFEERNISVTKHELNVILYGEDEIFDPNKDERNWPRWRLTKSFFQVHGSDMSAYIDEGRHYEAPNQRSTDYQWPKLLNLYKWQQEALDNWQAHNCVGAIQAVTGAGKTRLALAAIDVHLQDGYKVVVVVPTKELQDQWIDRIQKDINRLLNRKYRIGLLGNGHCNNLMECHILVAIIHSAHKQDLLPLKAKGLIVLDECHHYGSKSWSKVLQKGFIHRLGLSATLERDDDGSTKYIEPYLGKICFDLDYDRALKEEVISDFRITMIGVELDDDLLEEYKTYETRCSSNRRKLINQFDCPEEPFGEFMKCVVQLKNLGVPEAIRYMANFTKKRELVADSNIKQIALSHLYKFLVYSNKAIVFTQTISSAQQSSITVKNMGLTCKAITSQEGSFDRKESIKEFRLGELDAISGPKLLDEGIDIPDASLGIIIGASNSERQMRQRMGRILRRTDEKYLGDLVIVYAKDTFEDPKNGAHESFLDTVEEAAKEIYDFDLVIDSIKNQMYRLVGILYDEYGNTEFDEDFIESVNTEFDAINAFFEIRHTLDFYRM